MGRKCSHCGNVGHNSRTCNASKEGPINNNNNVVGGGAVRLFGVQLDIPSSIPIIKKSFSLDCLSSSSTTSSSSRVAPITEFPDKPSLGYLSDGRPSDRRKGVPWTEEEHRTFLMGLEKLGKGDWRGISRNFVTTRTPTQVASHAQKYFLRQASINKKKRRSSLFDMVGGGSERVCMQSKREFHVDLNSIGEDYRESCVELEYKSMELELRLSAPHDSSPSSLLIGPITVT